jgi:3-oxoacyl-[acyl-carrier-protein] synthase II
MAMAEKKRVVVTGMGMMSPVGISVDESWDNLINGRSGVGPITRFDHSECKVHVAGEITNLDATAFGFTPRDAGRYDRGVILGVCAATQAASQCGIDFAARGENLDVCSIVGTGIGGITNIEDTVRLMAAEGPRRVTPFLVPSGTPDVTSHTITMRYNLHGLSCGVNTACASGNEAIIMATRRLQQGPEVIAFTGGTDAAVYMLATATFGNLKALSTWDGDGDPARISRPFEKNRAGFVIAEGAGVLVLETLAHAQARGAEILAEIIGCGQTTDSYHITAPEPSGKYIAHAMRFALNDARIAPEEVDYINAHGTSTHYNDLTETLAIKQAFGDCAKRLAVSSTKSMTGHMIGGCGGVEACVCLKALATGIVPPTINYDEPDPELDLDYVPNVAREMPVRTVMSNNLGFGGHNAVVIFRRFA